MQHCGKFFLIAIGFQQLAAVLLGHIAGQRDLCTLAVLVEEQHVTTVIDCDRHEQRHFALFHFQLGSDIITQHAGLGIGKFRCAGFVHLGMVGKEEQLGAVGGLFGINHLVAVFQLLLARHAQALRGNFFEVAFPRKEHRDRVIRDLVLLIGSRIVRQVVQNFRFAGAAILFGNIAQLGHNDLADAGGAFENIFQVCDRLFQFLNFLGAFEDILTVEVAQLDFRHILSLHFVNAKPDHQVGHNLGFFRSVAHNFNCLINIQQDSFQAAQQVQTLLLALQIIVGAAAHAFGAECDPLQQNLAHAQHAGLAADQHIEVAGKTVLQRGCLEQTRHQLVRVLAALEVDGQLQAVQVGFITHIADLTDLAQFDQLGDLIHDGFHRCGRWNAGDVNAVVLFIVSPLGAHADAAAAFFQHILHLGGIIQDGTAADKIRRGHQLGQIRLVVFHQGDGCIAELHQVEGTDVGRHTDRNAQCVVGQNGREGDRQHRRFGGGTVIVGHKIHGILVDIAEQLFTHGFQLCLGVTSGGVSHIAAVRLAKVTLGVHKGHQQAFVGTAHTHHGVVNGGIAVGVQVHGAAHDVGAFGAGAFQQAHAVHGIQQFAVGGLEAVNFRQRAGNNNAHGVRHVVCFQCIGNGAFDDLTGREDLDVIAQLRAGRGGFLFGCFFCHFALSSPD